MKRRHTRQATADVDRHVAKALKIPVPAYQYMWTMHRRQREAALDQSPRTQEYRAREARSRRIRARFPNLQMQPRPKHDALIERIREHRDDLRALRRRPTKRGKRNA